MNITCLFSHDWSKDCEKCSKCGKTREGGHDWSKDCEKCSICGKTRDNHHIYSNNMLCVKCGKYDPNLLISTLFYRVAPYMPQFDLTVQEGSKSFISSWNHFYSNGDLFMRIIDEAIPDKHRFLPLVDDILYLLQRMGNMSYGSCLHDRLMDLKKCISAEEYVCAEQKMTPSFDSAVKLLLDNGMDPNIVLDKHTTEITLLVLAVLRGSVKAVVLLIARGSTVNRSINNIVNPLLLSIVFNHIDIVAQLLKTGIKVISQRWDLSPYYWAIRMRGETGSSQILELLNKHDSNNIDAIHGDGRSTLTGLVDLAVRAYDLNLYDDIGDVIEAGADVNAVDGWGENPLIIVAKNSPDFGQGEGIQTYCKRLDVCEKIAMFLLYLDADVNFQDNHGNSALLLAADKLNYTLVHLLKIFEANKFAVNHEGKSAYDLAKEATDKLRKLSYSPGAGYDAFEDHCVTNDIQNCRASLVIDLEISNEEALSVSPEKEVIITSKTRSKRDYDTIKNNMIFVEGGTFLMGPPSDVSNEEPPHSVDVSPFYMCKYIVTQREWINVMRYSYSKQKVEDESVERISLYRAVMELNPSFKKSKYRPVGGITWFMAVDFCNKISEMEGLSPCYTIKGKDVNCDFNCDGYRLPTEAEWEYAARGGKLSAGFAYSGSNNLDEVAWYDWDLCDVGTKKANELGIHDMSGSMNEWCWDWFNSYPSTAQTNPTGPEFGSEKVCRGGEYWQNNNDIYFRVNNRISTPPDKRHALFHSFRLVRTAKDI